MQQRRRTTPPRYRLHKASGNAVVTLNGRDVYLGKHGTKASRDEYNRIVGEWMTAGRTLPKDKAPAPLAVVQVLNAFRKAGVAPASHADEYYVVSMMIVGLYGRTPAADFGPLALKTVRAEMVARGWKRRTINQRIHYVRRMFRWAVEHEMVGAEQLAALRAVEPLREGSTTAPESSEVEPVDVAHVEASISEAPATVAAMVRLQMLTGMRAGELCDMTTADIDTSDPTVWVYRPGRHKTKHRGKKREVAIGPKAIDVLRPFLKPDLHAPIFSPAQADAERREAKAAARKTPLSCGNRPGTNRKPRPQRQPGDRYTTDSYRRAIEYATDKAFPPPAELARTRGETRTQWKVRLGKDWPKLIAHEKAHHWHPHQLRHTFATAVGNQFTMEHAQKALGHANLKATQIYAKLSLDKAKEVARAIG